MKLRASTSCRALAVLGAVLSSLAAPARAGSDLAPALDRASLSLGALDASPRIGLNADTRIGRLDTGDTDLDRVTLPRVRAEMLFGASQGLSLDYYRYDKSYTASLSGTASLDSRLKLDLGQLAYKWWLGRGSDVFGLGAGAAYYHVALDGTVHASMDGVGGSASGGDSDSAVAPLLELGWRHAFSQGWRMYGEASGIRKNGGRLTGHIYGGALGVEWYPVRDVGLVAEYGVSNIALHRDTDGGDGELDLRLRGPSLFLKARF